QLDAALKGIKNPVTREAVEFVFISLSRLCDMLRIVEINTGEEGPLPVTLTVFLLVDNEAKALIRFIEKKIPKLKSINGTLRQTLEGTSFALRHDLKKVFSQELAMLGKEQKSNQVRANVMRAHGLLINCCQQSILTLARVFNPAVSGKLL